MCNDDTLILIVKEQIQMIKNGEWTPGEKLELMEKLMDRVMKGRILGNEEG